MAMQVYRVARLAVSGDGSSATMVIDLTEAHVDFYAGASPGFPVSLGNIRKLLNVVADTPGTTVTSFNRELVTLSFDPILGPGEVSNLALSLYFEP